jgi:hypothetical protein
MVNSIKLKTVPLQLFVLYLLFALHAPYYHLHIQPNNTHISKHKHHSESAHYSADNHSHEAERNLFKVQTFKGDHQNVRHHLHFTRELYRPRKNTQSPPESYRNIAFNTISPVQTYNYTFTGTLYDSHKINYSPESSKTFSGLSPPLA